MSVENGEHLAQRPRAMVIRKRFGFGGAIDPLTPVNRVAMHQTIKGANRIPRHPEQAKEIALGKKRAAVNAWEGTAHQQHCT